MNSLPHAHRSVTARKPRSSYPVGILSCSLVLPPNESGCDCLIRITDAIGPLDYLVSLAPATGGRDPQSHEKRLTVQEVMSGKAVAVRVSHEMVRCDCAGFARWRSCRHAMAVVGLVADKVF